MSPGRLRRARRGGRSSDPASACRAKARAIELLGRVKVQELTTRQIRAWHKLISDEVSVYSANKALMILKAALALAAEDHELRPPAMPTGLQRRPERARKAVLSPDDVARLIDAARHNLDKGVYVALPFLAGTRPSEQLGLQWDDVDFEANVIRIRRIQLRDGSSPISPRRRRATGSIPMSPLLREILIAWRVRRPRRDGKLERVFPAPASRGHGRCHEWAEAGLSIHSNFRTRYWSDPEGPWAIGGHAPQRAPFLHLGVAGAGRRSGPRRQARWPQERGCDAQSLYDAYARRRGRGQGARPGLCRERAMTPARLAGCGELEARRISPFMRAPTAAKILREQYGEAEAGKLAARELQSAKRARSRKRFVFWAAVAKSLASHEANGSM